MILIATNKGEFLCCCITHLNKYHDLVISMYVIQKISFSKENFFSCFFSFHYIKLSGSSFIIMQGSQTETTKNCLLYGGHKSDTSDTIVLTQSKILLHNIKMKKKI